MGLYCLKARATSRRQFETVPSIISQSCLIVDCKFGQFNLFTIIQITSNLTSGKEQFDAMQPLPIDKSYNTIFSGSLKYFATYKKLDSGLRFSKTKVKENNQQI